MMRRLPMAAAIVSCLAVSACAGAQDVLGGGSGTTVTVAIVSNPQMQDAIKLSPEFEKDHPGSG